MSYVQECRTVVQVLNDLLSAYKLGMKEKWHQLCTDGTTWRQIALQSLVIGFITDEGFDSVITSP